MKLFALIGDQNEVVGIVKTTEDKLGFITAIYGQAIDVTDLVPQPQIGWAFNGANIVGTSPSKKITKLAMRNRFTFAELCALTGSADVRVRVLMDNLSVAAFVDLSRSDTVQGLGLLTALGLLTSDRANAILTTPVRIDEAYLS